jgi:alcohol dehydrogenase class IV
MMESRLFKMLTMVEYGIGVSEKVGEKAKEFGGHKALIVTDPGLKQTGLVDSVRNNLKKSGIESVVFDNIKGNPLISSVEQGLDIFKEEKCDITIAVGGGSPIDTAKAINIVEANGGHILDYEMFIDGMHNPITKRKKPLIVIPTTAGTGSEVTMWSVLTDPKRKYKASFGHPYMAPEYSLSDPTVTLTVPKGLTAAQGMDALTHAIEAYTSRYTMPQTDALALYAIKLISNNLRQAVAYGQNLKARDGMLMGSLMAGMAFGSAPVGAVHAMAHTLGGFYDTPHGVANAILLPWVMEYNLIACPERFGDIADAMGENVQGLSMIEKAEKAISAVKRLSKDVGIPSLSEVGCKEEDIPELARLAAQDMNVNGNPRPMPAEDMEKVYRKAM